MRPLLALAILIYLGFAFAFSGATPYRQPGILLGQRDAQGQPQRTQDVGAPDERQHANYVAHLMRGDGFPVLRPGSPDLYETYQSHQPPAYYLLAAGWARATGADPEDSATGHRLRWLNALIGVATLLGVYRAAAVGFGREEVGVLAAVATAATPMFVALHGAVSNDPLLFCLCTWALTVVASCLREGWTRRRAGALLLLVGAALLTKTTALALFPTVLGAALLAGSERRPLALRWSALSLGGAALIALPWWIRNQSLYGDPLGLRVFREAFVGTAQREQMIEMVGAMRQMRGLDPGGAAYEYWTQWFGWWTLRSWFGAFGQMDIFLPPLLYGGLAALALGGLLGWVLGLKTLEDDPAGRAYAAVGAVFSVVVFLLFLQFNLTYFQAQGRYLVPAVAAINGGLAFGGLYALRRVPAGAVAGVALVAGIVLNVFVLQTLGTQFERRTPPGIAMVTSPADPSSV